MKQRGGGEGHEGSAGCSQSALCKQASSWSGQVAPEGRWWWWRGSLHGPLRLSAKQITDGRNVAFVVKERESRGGGVRRGGGVQLVAESGGHQLTSTCCIHTAGPLAP